MPTTGDLFEFLRRVSVRVEAALSQNETLDVFGEDPVRVIRAAGGEGSTAALLLAAQGDSAFKETRTVTDLTLSTGRAIDMVRWHPSLPLVMAATPVPASAGFEARVGSSGQSQRWFVLIFTMTDFGAQIALQTPSEVTSLAWNPWDQGVIAAGTWSGQVIVWDIGSTMAQLTHRRGKGAKRAKAAAAAAAADADDATDGAAASSASAGGAADAGPAVSTGRSGTVHVAPTSVSHADRSHARPVRDLAWLPPASHLTQRMDAFVGADAAPRHATQLISTASDGTVRLWDTRFRERAKARGAVRAPPSDPSSIVGGLLPGAAALAAAKEPEVEWVPLFVANAADGAKLLTLSRLSLDPRRAANPLLVATEDGSLAAVDWCPGGLGTGHSLVADVEARVGPAAAKVAVDASGTADIVDDETRKGFDAAAEAAKSAVDAGGASGGGGGAAGGSGATDAIEAAGAAGVTESGGSRVLLHVPDLGRPPLAFERSPVLCDLVLSVGETFFSVWREGLRQPLFVSPPSQSRLTCGVFSPTRPGVVFLGRSDGLIDAWDLGDSTLRPVLSAPVVSTAVACMHFQRRGPAATGSSAEPSGVTSTDAAAVAERARQAGSRPSQLLAVGDEKGNVHVLEVPSALELTSERDFAQTVGFLERETKRVMYSTARAAMREVLTEVDRSRATVAADLKDKAEAEEEAEAESIRQILGPADTEEEDRRRVAAARTKRRIAEDEKRFGALRTALLAELGLDGESAGYGSKKQAGGAAAAAASGAGESKASEDA